MGEIAHPATLFYSRSSSATPESLGAASTGWPTKIWQC
jgi:hypothetical protein